MTHEEASIKLGSWVGRQRMIKDTLSAERRKRLEKIGFVWDRRYHQWEEGFDALLKFKSREGHCRVPKPQIEGDFNLGFWVSTQRSDRNLSPDQRQRLDAIGFAWNAYDQKKEEGFSILMLTV
jgi:hypothetical protein